MNKQKVCPTCNDEDLEIITVSPNRAYTLCTKNEHSGRDYFNPQELGGNTKIKNAVCNNCYHDLYLCSKADSKEVYHFHHMDPGCGESGKKNNCSCAQPEKHEMTHQHITCDNKMKKIKDAGFNTEKNSCFGHCCLCNQEHGGCNVDLDIRK